MVVEQLRASQANSTRMSLEDPGSNPACGPASNNIIIMMVPWMIILTYLSMVREACVPCDSQSRSKIT